jgi:hypothetical protein
MKKLLLIILLVLSFSLRAQERMNFLGISFSCSNKEFQEELVEKGFSYTGNYYYSGEFMGCIRLLDFIPSCIEDEIYQVILTCTHTSLELAVEDYYKLKRELTIGKLYWEVGYDKCIVYVDEGEIQLERTDYKVIITYIDKISENRVINQK